MMKNSNTEPIWFKVLIAVLCISAATIVTLYVKADFPTTEFNRDEIIKRWEKIHLTKIDPESEIHSYYTDGNGMIGVYQEDYEPKYISHQNENSFGVYFTDEGIVHMDYATMNYGKDVQMSAMIIEFKSENEAKTFCKNSYNTARKNGAAKFRFLDKENSGLDQKIMLNENNEKTEFLCFYQTKELVVMVHGTYKDEDHIKGAFSRAFNNPVIVSPKEVN